MRTLVHVTGRTGRICCGSGRMFLHTLDSRSMTGHTALNDRLSELRGGL